MANPHPLSAHAKPYVLRNEPGHWDSGGRVVAPFANDDQMNAILAALNPSTGGEKDQGSDLSKPTRLSGSHIVQQPRAALPPVGSVWRERDTRFERFIKVIGWQDMRGDPRVIIQTVTADDGRSVSARATRANPAAFGKRYQPVPTPLDDHVEPKP